MFFAGMGVIVQVTSVHESSVALGVYHSLRVPFENNPLGICMVGRKRGQTAM